MSVPVTPRTQPSLRKCAHEVVLEQDREKQAKRKDRCAVTFAKQAGCSSLQVLGTLQGCATTKMSGDCRNCRMRQCNILTSGMTSAASQKLLAAALVFRPEHVHGCAGLHGAIVLMHVCIYLCAWHMTVVWQHRRRVTPGMCSFLISNLLVHIRQKQD